MITNPIAQAQNRYMVLTFLSFTVIILYHTFSDLSRGFLIFFLGYRSDFGDKLRWVNDLHTTEKKVRYCIAHNPLLLQPPRHWFTLIYRKCEHLAVWVIRERSYWLSWALPFGIASPLTTFILYHKPFSLSIPFFLPSLIFFREDTWREPRGFEFSFSY